MTKERTIFIPYGKNPCDILQIRQLILEFNFVVQIQVNESWDRIITDDAISVTPFDMNVEKREMVRWGRHVLHLIESRMDNLDLMAGLNKEND